MSIIDSLKNLIGYSGSDLDHIFAIFSVIIVMYFVYSLFSVLVSAFNRKF